MVSMNTDQNEKSASEQIDDIITMHEGWKGEILSHIRRVILATDPDIVEEIKWRMKTRPEGLAVWSEGGIVCFAEVWKDNIKLIFSKGAKLQDPNKLFNSRLESKDVRAIEFKEGDSVNDSGLNELVREAVLLNKK